MCEMAQSLPDSNGFFWLLSTARGVSIESPFSVGVHADSTQPYYPNHDGRIGLLCLWKVPRKDILNPASLSLEN